MFQDELGPVTVAVPLEPGKDPIRPLVPATVPPFWIVSVPVPATPTVTPGLNHTEPKPSTVTVPFEPALFPMKPLTLFIVPPPLIVSSPMAFWPI
ncbi:hypothetical protein QIH80_28395 [Bradyrhizobium elkanii]|nr:hypothetical protein QIH80_28395 [Bradyrhizobium elkanii]